MVYCILLSFYMYFLPNSWSVKIKDRHWTDLQIKTLLQIKLECHNNFSTRHTELYAHLD